MSRRISRRSIVHFLVTIATAPLLCGLSVTVLLVPAADAQLSGVAVSEDAGTLSDVSTNLGDTTVPVRAGGGSLREGNAGRLGGAPVRLSTTGNVLSGPVSDVSRDQFAAPPPPNGLLDAASAAAFAGVPVTSDNDTFEPVGDIGGLQEQLQGLQPLARAVNDVNVAPDSDAAWADGAGAMDTGDRAGALAYTDDAATEQLDLGKQRWYGQQQPQTGPSDVVQPPAPSVDDVDGQHENVPAAELGGENAEPPPPVRVPEALP